MRIHRLALPVAALLLALTLPGQLPLGWARKDRMTARAAVGMAEDTGRGRLVMFGGIYTPQTWEWDGLAWTLRAPAMSPPVLGGCAMAYDPQRGRTLLFGGDSGILSPRDDTWEWDGTTWTQQSPAAKPGPRRHHGMAYDAARRRIVLFGGYNGATYRVLNDTWEWDGTTWTQATPRSRPAAFCHARLRRARQRIVLFSETQTGETWTWDGATWTLLRPASSPPARAGHGLAYDPIRQRVVLFGGQSLVTGQNLADTWEWDGTTWSQAFSQPTPPPRVYHRLAWYGPQQRIVLFGTVGVEADYWEWDGTRWQERQIATSTGGSGFLSGGAPGL